MIQNSKQPTPCAHVNATHETRLDRLYLAWNPVWERYARIEREEREKENKARLTRTKQ